MERFISSWFEIREKFKTAKCISLRLISDIKSCSGCVSNFSLPKRRRSLLFLMLHIRAQKVDSSREVTKKL